MPSSHSIRAVLAALALAVATPSSAQIVPVAPPLPETNATSFTIFLRAQPCAKIECINPNAKHIRMAKALR